MLSGSCQDRTEKCNMMVMQIEFSHVWDWDAHTIVRWEVEADEGEWHEAIMLICIMPSQLIRKCSCSEVAPQSFCCHHTSAGRTCIAPQSASASAAALAASHHTSWSCPASGGTRAARLVPSSQSGGHEASHLPTEHQCCPCKPRNLNGCGVLCRSALYGTATGRITISDRCIRSTWYCSGSCQTKPKLRQRLT